VANIVSNLAQMAKRINAEHAAAVTAVRSGLEHARRAGQLLAEAKAACGHGKWLPWLEANVELSERTVQGYMQLAKHWEELQANPQQIADLTLRGALDLLALPGESPRLKRRRRLNQEAEESVPSSIRGVLTASERWHVEVAEAMEWVCSLPDNAAYPGMFLFSQPYADRRSYCGLPPLVGEEWVAYYVKLIREALRVAPLVCCVCDSPTENFSWTGLQHLLAADLLRGGVTLRHDANYVRIGIPGSGGDDWYRNDCETILCATRGGPLPWSDNTAAGHAPVYPPGGAPSHRKKDGSRVRTGPNGLKNGDLAPRRGYVPPEKANPGNLLQKTYTALEVAEMLEERSGIIRCKVGGGVMGDTLCHESQAPYAEKLCHDLISSFCPPGGIVVDPFCGSGTTLAVAVALKRRAIGCDIDPEQVELTRQRLEETKEIEEAG
jgi:hypothetical protein